VVAISARLRAEFRGQYAHLSESRESNIYDVSGTDKHPPLCPLPSREGEILEKKELSIMSPDPTSSPLTGED